MRQLRDDVAQHQALSRLRCDGQMNRTGGDNEPEQVKMHRSHKYVEDFGGCGGARVEHSRADGARWQA